MSSDVPSPFNFLWERNYPFEYWENRLEKINRYNEQDRFEALYTATLLSDIYTHVFTAKVRNPELPWFIIKEETYRRQIDDVLEDLYLYGFPMVEQLLEHSGSMVNIETNEDYDIDKLDAISAGILGCPLSIDDETQTVEFHEDPDLHRGICNAILKFAEGMKELLNDFKHGFRVIPVTPDDLGLLRKEIVRFDPKDAEKYVSTTEELENKLFNQWGWDFAFARMNTKSTDYGYDCQLDVYYVDAWACYKFAELMLDALYNLITPQGGRHLEDKLLQTPGLGNTGEFSVLNHELGFAVPIRDDPDTQITKEEFLSEESGSN